MLFSKNVVMFECDSVLKSNNRHGIRVPNSNINVMPSRRSCRYRRHSISPLKKFRRLVLGHTIVCASKPRCV